ncbi:neuronal PAS domain-containing protein 1 [Pseudoliparis swirei]|uniref:neuronal PAS domain-containing protein 1 n=1 Tax=Pseudoliparis swirei TaxID=2059687 RepID=UPI0024BE2F68|nr:neuronal PAS domain-containing protein 1 [Pseudoliparis swirei]XP_056297896.1 neuronal PAS domain-containing protein 1 [Pseudoliparis swirei]XP_056297897.1 neuronal PAS domain-containing protein 1 [Pseudoliparis swirei]
MATMPFVSEGKCVSVEWDFLQGLLAKPPTLPCLQNLRKEKSRNAARSRRGKENFEFFELAKMLPLPGAITSQLDKASVIRLTISYLHMRTFASQGDPPWSPLMQGDSHCRKVRRSSNSRATDMFEQHLGAHLLQSLDGFVFVVSQEGRFLYISETVSIYLGLSQVELTGSSVFDYIHPADHVEMAERLGIRPHLRAEAGCHTGPESASSSASASSLAGTPEPAPSSPHSPANEPHDRGYFIRMKSTLTKRGLHVKSSGYKVIHVTGRIRCRPALVPGSARSVRRPIGLVSLAHTLPPSSLNEVRMESQMFVCRVNMDLQVTYCENRISEYMDLTPAEVVGHTCYHFIHVEDLENLRHSHEDLLRKGQVVTSYYRWLQRRGGYLWIQSSATVSINHKAPHERNVIWVNYVLSRTELPDTPLDILQLPENVRAERLRVSSSPTGSSPQARGSQPAKSSLGKSDPDTKGRDKFTPAAIQSEDRRKRLLRSDPEGAPPETRRRLEELRPAEESVSASSDLASESEGEEEEEEEEETEWDQGGNGDRLKEEDGGGGGKLSRGGGGGGGGGGGDTPTGGARGSRLHNGRAVIQQLKSAVAPPPLPGSPGVKTEHAALTPGGGGGRWEPRTPAPRAHAAQPPPSHAHTPSSSLNGDSPTTPAPDSSSSGGEAPPKGLFTPPSPALSPAVSVSSPLPREDRAAAAGSVTRSGGGGACGVPDFELLQRLAAAGGAAGRVLFHPLALGPQGPQSLYAPSTIRYAPPDLPHHHGIEHGDGLQLRSDHHKGPPPPPAFFPHLQRLAGLPPFSGFSPSDGPFPSGLPFCMNGLRGAAGSEED